MKAASLGSTRFFSVVNAAIDALAAAPASNRWLYGPVQDLLLGCGLLYVIIFLITAAAGSQIRAAEAPYLLPLLIQLISIPHYGGTLLRVYERRGDRRGYALFTIWATLALFLIFVAAVHDPRIGALMLTVYLTWSPWHYTGQNYGISMMFLRRRKIAVTPAMKRWVYASFMLSFILTFLVMHTDVRSAPDLLTSSEGASIRFMSLGIPYGFSAIALPIVAAGYATALVGAATLLLRRAAVGAATRSISRRRSWPETSHGFCRRSSSARIASVAFPGMRGWRSWSRPS